jgi:hypothetical protein
MVACKDLGAVAERSAMKDLRNQKKLLPCLAVALSRNGGNKRIGV